MMLKFISMIAVVFAGIFPTPAFSADMIGYYESPRAQARQHYGTTRTAYADTRYCEELLVNYRPPNQPRTEVVAVCAPPPF